LSWGSGRSDRTQGEILRDWGAGFWVGADPGGVNGFGLAFLDSSGGVECLTVSSVDKAAGRIAAKGKPLGLGTDAPMWRSSRRGAGRKADEGLRKKYSIRSGAGRGSERERRTSAPELRFVHKIRKFTETT